MGSLAPPTAGRPERAPRHRPLVPVLAGAAVGIAMDGLLAPPVWFWLAAGLGILIPALWGLRRGLRQWGNWALALMLVVPVAGAYHAMRFRLQPPWHLSNMSLEEGGLYRVEGRVASSPRSHHRSAAYSPRGAGAGRFWAVRVKLDGLTGAGERRRRTAGGLTLFSDRRPDVRAGDRVRATVRLHRNRPPTNPGQPDAATRYARRGNHATARLADPG
ncbi:MAG: ComEC/Rec2 family competence protein, partial [Candidatus Brocadiia bacterium]